MRKQELVHLHGLLAVVRRRCEDDGFDIDLSTYQSLGTDESSIHRGKDEHREAVFALVSAITAAVDNDRAAVTAPG